MDSGRGPVRIGVVLSAGGLRGAAHVGVLRQLVRHNIPIDVIVGVSAGAVVAAYYAAVGLDLDELIADARTFRGRHLLAHSVNVHLNYRFERHLKRWCGVIPDRLRQLESASFDQLYHGVRRLWIVCHDLSTGRPRYFGTGFEHAVKLHEVVRASASIPWVFPAVSLSSSDKEMQLTDGGLSDPVPVTFARGPAVDATHIIVSDCRWLGGVRPTDRGTVWIRPRMAHTGTLWSPRLGLAEAVRNGEAAVTEEILARIRGWFTDIAGATPLATAV